MSDKINDLSVHAERFFVRLIMKADDYGCFHADTRLLKANLYPLLLDAVREADLSRWMAECQKAGLIVLYEHTGKKYLQINDFRQRLDKAKSKYPLPTDNDVHRVVNDYPAEVEVETEPEKKAERPKGLAASAATADDQRELKNEFKILCDSLTGKDLPGIWVALKTFITDRSPQFIEPYFEAWNVFASHYGLSKIDKVNDTRRKKMQTRLREGMEFLKVLDGIRTSSHLKGDNQRGWRATFDWIIENDSNYLKIIEGHYN